ncbi:unnamed protein product [Amoebophrya sp. A25]|nr:unnamed protein product [Amoebophrya sp. A25]|eukprot:GSA25T00009978001.1
MASFKRKNQNKKNSKGLKTYQGGDGKPTDKAEPGEQTNAAGYVLNNPLKGYNKVVEMQNAAFERYYRDQGICESEEEFKTFMATCRTGLPCGVRVNGTLGQHARMLWKQFHSLLALPAEEETSKVTTTASASTAEQNCSPTSAATETSPSKAEKKADAAASEGTHASAAVDDSKTNKEEGIKTEYAQEVEGSEKKLSETKGAASATSQSTPPYMLRPKTLSWYPRGLAFQFDYLDARAIKKDANFRFLKQFLMNREVYGAIQRQEAVSMIPPHLLNIQPDDLVLDLCAAPGSKTCQMLERMHWESQASSGNADGPSQFTVGRGGVLANDVEWKRANMLTHQVQRIGSPAVGVLNTDAQFFPTMKRADGSGVNFDKVLCDVPCSGDGTVRKTPNIWRTWTVSDGLGLHYRQLAILWRGLDVLRVGGRLVYSTCSLNPMENESVIAACLERCGLTAVEVVEADFLSHENVSLNGRKGLTTWKVPLPKGSAGMYIASYEETPQALRESNKIRKSMFPPPAVGTDGANEKTAQICEQLQRTRRFLPHLMNTGGFFVAVLEKKAELPRQQERLERQKAWHEKQRLLQEEAAASAASAPVSEAEPPTKKLKVEDGTEQVNTTTEQDEKSKAEVESVEPKKVAQAVKEQSSDAPAADDNGAASSQENNKSDAEDAKKDDRLTPSKPSEEDKFVPIDSDEWQCIQDYYGLPASARTHFYKRPHMHGDHKIYGISEKLRDVVECCQNTGSTKVISCGIRCFQMLNSFGGECGWRVTQQGLLYLIRLGLSPRRILNVQPGLLLKLLEVRELKTQDVLEKSAEFFTSSEEVSKFAPQKQDQQSSQDDRSKIAVGQGSYALYCAEFDLHVCVIVSRNYFTLYVDKQEAKALLACLQVGPDLAKEMGFTS